jgi:hypothetical protein
MRTQIILLLAAVIGIAILAILNLLILATGHVARPSLFLVFITIFCVAGMWQYRRVALRLAFSMAGAQAALRLALWLAHAQIRWQWGAAVGGELAVVVSAIIVIVVIVKWLDSAGRSQSSSNRENPTS